MANMMIRNLPDEIHDKLKEQATMNKRSLEAEARSILSAGVSEQGFGQRLRARFKGIEGDELIVSRDEMPGEPVTLE